MSILAPVQVLVTYVGNSWMFSQLLDVLDVATCIFMLSCLLMMEGSFSLPLYSSIVVSNVTFTYSIENLSRNQFEIRTSDMVDNFQASKDATF